ncbi:MAG: transposase [Gemmataceae bacterium]
MDERAGDGGVADGHPAVRPVHRRLQPQGDPLTDPAAGAEPKGSPAPAYCGRSPREFKSGASVRGRTRLSKSGNARLRKALDPPTLTAVRFNPVLAGFFDRLEKAGKPRMQAVGACMRKLVMICYGMLKNRAPFDPNWASRIAT